MGHQMRKKENRMNLQNITVTACLDGVDAAKQKAVELAEKINEAKTLAGELASLTEKLEVKVEV